MNASKRWWPLIAFSLAYFLVLGLIYLVESRHPDGNIHSLTDAFWYSLVTLTTVGYGDFYPVSFVGRVLSLFFVFGSLGLLGLFISNVTESFYKRQEFKKMGYKGTDFEKHVIILGWNSFAHSITEQLLASHTKVAIVTGQKDNIDLIYEEFGKEEVFVLFSDPKTSNLLDRLNPAQSSVIFVNLENDTDKLITVLNLKKEYPKIEFMVILDNTDLKGTFSSAGVTFILSKNEIAAKLVASFIFEPDVANLTSDLLSSAEEGKEDDYDIQQYKVLPQNPFLNSNFGDTLVKLKTDFNAVLLAIARIEDGQRKLYKVPSNDFLIKENDYLIMVVNEAKLSLIRESFGTLEGI
ncbi:MAG: ion channel [Bacteroidia bacterium]|nr:ion channel [Bacteroidia bacterium]